jgi:hypothetical protein
LPACGGDCETNFAAAPKLCWAAAREHFESHIRYTEKRNVKIFVDFFRKTDYDGFVVNGIAGGACPAILV